MVMARTNRIYHYHVQLSFKGVGAAAKIGRKTSGYTGALAYQDTFIFYNKKCNLVLSRSKKYDDGTILSNINNTVNSQIIKALLCYYAITQDFPTVDNISIIRKQMVAPDYTYAETVDLIQPIVSKVPRTLVCNPNIIDGLLDDNPRGQALRISMSYWLKGIASDDVYYKFEHLWRAFNRLYMYYGKQPKEFDNMVLMRGFIINHSHLFPKSIAVTNSYSDAQLLDFRWSRMILNDYDTPNKTSALAAFVCRYHDGRIMRVLREKLVCRNDNLIAAGLLSKVNNHISLHTTDTVDAELVTLIAIKYAYFVRNKMFHGEVIDGTFRIRNNNLDAEIQKLNALLEVLVMEIMENYQHL